MTYRLPSRFYYGLILAGVLLGSLGSILAAWVYLQADDRRPDAARIWQDVAASFVVPVAAMVGGTFGGIAGVAVAVALNRRRSSSEPTR